MGPRLKSDWYPNEPSVREVRRGNWEPSQLSENEDDAERRGVISKEHVCGEKLHMVSSLNSGQRCKIIAQNASGKFRSGGKRSTSPSSPAPRLCLTTIENVVKLLNSNS